MRMDDGDGDRGVPVRMSPWYIETTHDTQRLDLDKEHRDGWIHEET